MEDDFKRQMYLTWQLTHAMMSHVNQVSVMEQDHNGHFEL